MCCSGLNSSFLIHIEFRNFCFVVWIQFDHLHTCPLGQMIGWEGLGGWLFIPLMILSNFHFLRFAQKCYFQAVNFFFDKRTDQPTDKPTYRSSLPELNNKVYYTDDFPHFIILNNAFSSKSSVGFSRWEWLDNFRFLLRPITLGLPTFVFKGVF